MQTVKLRVDDFGRCGAGVAFTGFRAEGEACTLTLSNYGDHYSYNGVVREIETVHGQAADRQPGQGISRYVLCHIEVSDEAADVIQRVQDDQSPYPIGPVPE